MIIPGRFRVLLGGTFLAAIFVVVADHARVQAGEHFASRQAEGAPTFALLRLRGALVRIYPLLIAAAPGIVAWSLIEVPTALRWTVPALRGDAWDPGTNPGWRRGGAFRDDGLVARGDDSHDDSMDTFPRSRMTN
jgi:hypothetical protein